MSEHLNPILAEDLVAMAILAPSSHNTQPWLFRVGDDAIDLIADRTRALPVNDPDDRELTISCGAALFNLRVAARAASRTVEVALLPDPRDPDLLARMRVTGHGEPGPGEATLAAAIPRRRTHRGAFAPPAVTDRSLTALTWAAEAEGARLAVMTGDDRSDLVGLVAEGDRIQFDDPRWRRELASWMHTRRHGDGLALAAPIVPFARASVALLDLGASVAARDEERADDAPLLAVLSTPDDTTRDWLVGGQALERVLLTATAEGLQAGHLNQPCQVADLRHRVARLLPGGGVPQVVLMLGIPDHEHPATPRRPLAQVVE